MDPRTEKALLKITTSFREPLSLQSLADDVDLSPFHFHRLFKSDTGETPADYLLRVRLEYAAHMLIMMPDAAMLAIALDSGFVSAANFARAFKRRYGVSASAYRAANPLPCGAVSNALSLNFRRVPERVLSVQRCELNESALSAAYQQLARIPMPAPRAAVGIFVDMPFHQARHLCRHFLALDKPTAADAVETMHIPGGLYLVLELSGDLDAASANILKYHAEHIAPSDYAVASTLAFERLLLPIEGEPFDYSRARRELFIKVRRKNEPVI